MPLITTGGDTASAEVTVQANENSRVVQVDLLDVSSHKENKAFFFFPLY